MNTPPLPPQDIVEQDECENCGTMFDGEGWKKLCLDCWKEEQAG